MKKKIMIKLENVNDKTKAFKVVSGIPGIECLSVDNENVMTIIGNVDPVSVVMNLGKFNPDLLRVGPAAEEKKKMKEKKMKGQEEEEKEEAGGWGSITRCRHHHHHFLKTIPQVSV
ncbi:hypothetical protein HanLR1_Chr00c2753g0855991 [Helianthus annuus]|nr:hypothetical protein HanLR1_Chr00c2753g0855991 [Helianthus annuus]